MTLPLTRCSEPARIDMSMLELADIRERIEERLDAVISAPSHAPAHLTNALRHALLAPSKRLRPIMLVLIAEPDAVGLQAAIDAACAVEMVHTASLILDDLPCMDDAQFRRQRPTTHVAFGEATAVLASITLLTRAFGVLANLPETSPDTCAQLAEILSESVGANGLAAGQEIDLNGSERLGSIDAVEQLNWLKTGILFVAAAEMGAVLRGLSPAKVEAVRRFARHFGMAFQTADDLIDVSATPEQAGKDVLKDGNKPTLVSLLGADHARLSSHDHMRAADKALVESGVSTGPIRGLATRFFGEWPVVDA